VDTMSNVATTVGSQFGLVATQPCMCSDELETVVFMLPRNLVCTEQASIDLSCWYFWKCRGWAEDALLLKVVIPCDQMSVWSHRDELWP
jgi:hypothetical protein